MIELLPENKKHEKWLIDSGITNKVSSLGSRVAQCLDIVFGLHHMSVRQLEKADWSNETWIEVGRGGELAAWDGSDLTYLLVVSNLCGLRLSISGRTHRYLNLMFHKREVVKTVQEVYSQPLGQSYLTMPEIEHFVGRIKENLWRRYKS